MARGSHIEWTIRPNAQIGAKLARMQEAKPAIAAMAGTHAARAEGAMKAGAPWNDQTGYARASLYARAEGTDIELGTTNSEYGPFLELGTSKMAARPIIKPTADQTAPAYFDDAAEVVRRLMGG